MSNLRHTSTQTSSHHYGMYVYKGPNTSGTLLGQYSRVFNKNTTHTSDNEYLYVKYYVPTYTAVDSTYFHPYSSSYLDYFETA